MLPGHHNCADSPTNQLTVCPNDNLVMKMHINNIIVVLYVEVKGNQFDFTFNRAVAIVDI